MALFSWNIDFHFTKTTKCRKGKRKLIGRNRNEPKRGIIVCVCKLKIASVSLKLKLKTLASYNTSHNGVVSVKLL
ncbi:hypothetical protein VNO80_09733 [Phaseolus coccineus]|uniref:Uncharacterized protein n=1 Tax=Phaseolus coccineus TaxID=3886 RepID=A0AAN9R9U5_PHACN